METIDEQLVVEAAAFVEQALAEKEGLDYAQEEAAQITEPFDPGQIRVTAEVMTIDLVIKRIRHNEINLAPDFQRESGIWPERLQSQLIESVLLRIPLPAFYMDASNEDEWLVIDGLQRLTTFKRFMLEKTLRLSSLEFLRQYNGCTFDELPRSLQRRIEETQITVYLVQKGTPPNVKFNIFKRINTLGLPLSAQEIRHTLHRGPAATLLRELAQTKEFLLATEESINPIRMADRELVLRFLAFALKDYRNYTSKDELDQLLNETMAAINAMSNTERAELVVRFRRAMAAAHRVLGNKAFRKINPDTERRSNISKALFETWSVAFDGLSNDEIEQLVARQALLEEKFLSLMRDKSFVSAITYGTSNVQKVHERFSKIDMIVRETLVE